MAGMHVTVRTMAESDAENVAALLPDLGYEATAEQVRARLSALHQWPDQEAWVACVGPSVLGLCHAQGVRLLATSGYAEIQALVVAQTHQRRGIGASLLRHAVSWAFEHGYDRVRLRSGLHREGAHQFYESLGFSRARQSYAFEVLRGGAERSRAVGEWTNSESG